jgi:hypothetical protein
MVNRLGDDGDLARERIESEVSGQTSENDFSELSELSDGSDVRDLSDVSEGKSEER